MIISASEKNKSNTKKLSNISTVLPANSRIKGTLPFTS